MADNETIADIIAEMRGFKRYSASDSSDCRYVAYWLYQTFADRLEAALERERGNEAKLREALDEAENGLFRWQSGSMNRDTHRKLIAMINTALAAPPRNCDKVKTSWEVLKEWHEGLDTANDIVRLLDWLLAPATEKEGGNDAD